MTRMRDRDRDRDRNRLENPHRNEGQRPEAPDSESAAPLLEARDRGQELLDAAERALSGDSHRFLQASRQHGGQ